MIKRVHLDKRKYPIRAYVTFTDGTAYKGKGKTTKLAVRAAIEHAKKEKNMPIQRCFGCDHYNSHSGCEHPKTKTKEFAAIPINKCYVKKGEDDDKGESAGK